MDESGDLGWKFDRPYQSGGSSRFLTLSTIVVHENDKHRPERVMKKLKEYLVKKYGSEKFDPKEIKSTDLMVEDRTKFCELFCNEVLKSKKFFKVYSKTVNKINVRRAVFKEDPNTLYNYTTSFILEKVKDLEHVTLFADERVTSTEARMSFDLYLKTKLAGDMGSDTILNIDHKDSKDSKQIQCADIIANTIWRSYEFGIHGPFDTISPHVNDGKLFF